MLFLSKKKIHFFYLCTTLLVVCVLVVLRPWADDFDHVHYRSIEFATVDRVKGSLDATSLYKGYVRDQRGYIYPEGYFELAPPGISPSFKHTDMRGRHSDAVLPECENFTDGAGPEISNVYDYRVPTFNLSQSHKNPCWYSGSALRCIPYFYFIGTPKAGTTDLYWRLTKHPDVTKCGAKERRFFDKMRFIKAPWSRYNYYLYSFGNASGNIRRRDTNGSRNEMIFGDGSPTYMYNNVKWVKFPGNEGCLEPRITCVSYIHYIYPAAKLILIMRNPIDRLYSSYLYNYAKTGALRTPEQFHEWSSKAIQAHVECFKNNPFRSCLYDQKIIKETILTLSAGIYSRLILDVLKLFPRKQLHVLKMEDYSANIQPHMIELFEFLGLAPLPQKEVDVIASKRQQNTGPSYRVAGPMLPETRKMLYDFYKPFNEELAYILQDDKYLWHEDFPTV